MESTSSADIVVTSGIWLAGAKLSVILVSHLSWAAGNFEHSTMRSPRPIQIHFPAYEAHQLANVGPLHPPEGAPLRHLMTAVLGR